MQNNEGLAQPTGASAPSPQTLEGLRAEIDRIDDALLELVERRLAASLAVAELKQAAPGGHLKLRPRREAAIIARLTEKARHSPPALIAHVWRELMGHSLQAQVETELVLCASAKPDALRERVRQRFGSAAPTSWTATPDEALDIARRREAVAVIEQNPAAHWWVGLADSGLAAFDIVDDGNGRPMGIAVGRVAPEDLVDGPAVFVLEEAELGERIARGEAIEPLAACGTLRLCRPLRTSEGAGR